MNEKQIEADVHPRSTLDTCIFHLVANDHDDAIINGHGHIQSRLAASVPNKAHTFLFSRTTNLTKIPLPLLIILFAHNMRTYEVGPKGADAVVLTTGMWTSKEVESYQMYTGCFIHQLWPLVTFVLATWQFP